jgi:hypothetical protein
MGGPGTRDGEKENPKSDPCLNQTRKDGPPADFSIGAIARAGKPLFVDAARDVYLQHVELA